MLDKKHGELSVRKQSQLLSLNRSSCYYKKVETSKEDVMLMNEIRNIWERYPFYGYRRITTELRSQGQRVNQKRVQRLMTEMGLCAMYPKPKTSLKNKGHAIYPYLLRGLTIARPNQAWMVEIVS